MIGISMMEIGEFTTELSLLGSFGLVKPEEFCLTYVDVLNEIAVVFKVVQIWVGRG